MAIQLSLGTILLSIGLFTGGDRIDMMLNAFACTLERRHHSRESVDVPCTVNWAGLYEFATIKNMSIYGAQLEGFKFPPVGTQVTIVVDQVELCASIIWPDGHKCGVLLEHDVDPALFIRQHSIRPLGHVILPIGTVSELLPLGVC